MISIQEESQNISNRLVERYSEITLELNEVNTLINETSKEFRSAVDKGDLRENAAYSEAKDKLTRLNTHKIYLLKTKEAIQSVSNSSVNYVSKDYIDIYSTFRLLREDTNEISSWKVFPTFLSDVEKGIMSHESDIFKQLKGKCKDDVIIATNRVTNKKVSYRILEVF